MERIWVASDEDLGGKQEHGDDEPKDDKPKCNGVKHEEK